MNIQELEEEVIKCLKKVYDPEISINIYELGLIYDIKITDQNEVVVLMTLTSAYCPEAQSLPEEIEYRLREIPEIKDVRVIITFDTPWDKSMMSEAAQLELGLF